MSFLKSVMEFAFVILFCITFFCTVFYLLSLIADFISGIRDIKEDGFLDKLISCQEAFSSGMIFGLFSLLMLGSCYCALLRVLGGE